MTAYDYRRLGTLLVCVINVCMYGAWHFWWNLGAAVLIAGVFLWELSEHEEE